MGGDTENVGGIPRYGGCFGWLRFGFSELDYFGDEISSKRRDHDAFDVGFWRLCFWVS